MLVEEPYKIYAAFEESYSLLLILNCPLNFKEVERGGEVIRCYPV